MGHKLSNFRLQRVVWTRLNVNMDVRILIHLRNKHCADSEKRANQAILDCTSEKWFGWSLTEPSPQIHSSLNMNFLPLAFPLTSRLEFVRLFSD